MKNCFVYSLCQKLVKEIVNFLQNQLYLQDSVRLSYRPQNAGKNQQCKPVVVRETRALLVMRKQTSVLKQKLNALS